MESLFILKKLHLVSSHFCSDQAQECEIRHDEDQEVLVVFETEAVVDEWTVMVEHLNAALAEQTVERCL